MYQYLFGPVPSRRLGMSLGVDLVPKKVCSLDCVYCEVGKTTKLTLEKKEYIKADKVKIELSHYFESHPDPDYITFSGSGEPTLNSALEDILLFIKKMRPDIPVAVLTNGTLLSDAKVRKALMNADVVLPSLDAATQEGFEKINRPESHLDIEQYVQGLVDFSHDFKGQIWLEVFMLPDFNTSEQELRALRQAILRIAPDSVQINTLDRPGTVPHLRGATHEALHEIVRCLDLPNVDIIAAAPERKKVQSYRIDTETAIVETIARRPCTLNDLSKILGRHVNEINKYLDVLEADGRIEVKEEARGVFYRLSSK